MLPRQYYHPRTILLYGVLLFFAILSIGPFIWLLSTSLKSSQENIFAYPPVFIPLNPTWGNFVEVCQQIPLLKYMFNSTVVAISTVILNVLLSSLAGYPLATMNFKGKNIIFLSILATMMIPFQVIMIPVYMIVLALKLVDTYSTIAGYAGLILPFAVNAFGIFLMRQAFMTVPKDLVEAAIIDGCSHFKIWYNLMLPLTLPAILTLAVFTFVGCWSEFLWPSIILSKQEMYTLPLGLNHLQGVFSANWRYISAGAIISVIPILIFFLLTQKYFLKHSIDGALK